MSREYDTSAEEVGRTIADLLKGARLMPDMADVWRAIGERHIRNRMHSEQAGSQRAAVSDVDPLALMVKANALVVNAGVRMGLDWQRLVSRRLPAIRRRVDEYRAEADPLPEVRNALLDEVALFLTELAEFASDQGRALQQDIEVFGRRLLPGERIVPAGQKPQPVRRKKIFSSAVQEQLATSAREVARVLQLEKDMDRLKEAIGRWRERADPHIREMLDHQFNRCVRIVPTVRTEKAGRKVDADIAAGAADRRQLRIGEIARMRAQGMRIGMRGDEGRIADRRDIPESAFVEMR